MTPTISAIIVNYNAGPLLRDCIDSLLNCPLDIDIIVVDNNSSDGSLDGLAALPQVRIIRNSANMGFAAACNIGALLSSAPFLLFLNPDCCFRAGSVHTLLAALQADSQAAIAGGLLLNEDGTEQGGGRRAVPTPWRSLVRALRLHRFAHRWPKLFFDFHLHRQPLPAHPIEVEAISGACMLVNREAVAEVGWWDDDYFLHCEDLDWCMRFRQKGWKILFVPDARIIHTRGVCCQDRRLFVEWHKHKGMMRFYRKFFRHQYPGVLMGLVAVGVWLRFAVVAAGVMLRRLGRLLGR
ncbi:MAG: glycosyltransferase family 2 protein [Desulfobulbaceae bacterium]|jgi:hypothetical protein|nr:glycosyltransferase family 2 protein [Desulfobulbaceae bacterium]